jgi:hypothetical protein
MDNEMIERVAKAIKDDWLTNSAIDIDDFFKYLAKAAIKAMREPTEKMKTLVTDDVVITDKCYYCGGHIQGWQAMIDCITHD